MRIAALLGVAGLVVAVDQGSKAWAVSKNLAVINKGVSFSLVDGVSHWVLIGLSICILITLARWKGREVMQKNWLAGALFLGGAVSNVLDRVFVGGVQDWIELPFMPWKNNVADICIVGSLSLFALQFFLESRTLKNTLKVE